MDQKIQLKKTNDGNVDGRNAFRQDWVEGI
jgi:hypothetical protein